MLNITPDVTTFTSDSNALLNGNVKIASGTNISLSQSGQTVTINTTGVATNTPTYLTVNNESGTLPNSRRIAVNSTNLTGTDGGPGSTYVLNTIQDISTSSIPSFARIILSGSSNQNFINGSGTLSGTGPKTAYTLGYTTNLSSGSDTGLLISMTDTSSPGTSLPLDIQVGGSSKLNVDNTGLLTAQNVTISTMTAGSVLFAGTSGAVSQDNSNLYFDDTNNRLGIGTNAPNTTLEVQGQTRLYNQNFTYPTGGYNVIQHSPTVSTINNATPVLRLITAAPTLSYETAMSMGFATNSFCNFSPTYQSAGAIGPGSDTGNLVVFNLIPIYDGTTGPRTMNQMFGMFIQPRCNGGTVAGLTGISVGTNNIGGTTTTATALSIAAHAVSAGGAITTGIGLSIANQTAATTNWSMQVGTAQSYHAGPIKIGAASAPTATYILDVVGNCQFSSTVWNLTTLTSFTMQNVLGNPILFVDATSTRLKTNPVYVQPTASTGSVAPALTTTVPANTALTASTELPELLIDMSATQTWLTGTIASQRGLKILAPTYDMSGGLGTFTEACTVYISGPPAMGSGAQATTSIGFKLDQRTLTTSTATGIGFQVYAPTGALTNACGSFMGGNVGINSLSPDTWLDIKVDSITSTNNNVVCIDGTTRYVGCYMGGTAITSAPSSNTSVLLLDFGWAPSANSAFNVGTSQAIFTLQGAVNTTGNIRGLNNQVILDTTGGTATQMNGITSAVQSTAASSGSITTARSYQSTNSISGTGTITTMVGYDNLFSYSNVAGTTTTTIGLRIGNVSKGASYTLTNFYGVRIEDQTATFGTDKIGFYQLGSNLTNRFVGSTVVGVDAAPGDVFDVANKLTVNSNGVINKYDNLTTAGLGVPAILQGPAISATKTANFTVFSYTPAASSAVMKVYAVITTTSSTNSGTVQVVLDFKDSFGTVHTADIIPLVDAAGSVATTKSGASKEFHTIPWLFTIDNSATAIALKVVITGTVSYTVVGTIERVI